jgi:hypothetical protein
VSQGINSAIGYNPAQGFDFGKSLLSGVAGSVGQAVRGGKVSAATVATDAFGSILGDSLAWDNSTRNPSSINYENELDRQSDAAYEARRTAQSIAQSDEIQRRRLGITSAYNGGAAWTADVAARKQALTPSWLTSGNAASLGADGRVSQNAPSAGAATPTPNPELSREQFRRQEIEYRNATEVRANGRTLWQIASEMAGTGASNATVNAIKNGLVVANPGLKDPNVVPRDYFVSTALAGVTVTAADVNRIVNADTSYQQALQARAEVKRLAALSDVNNPAGFRSASAYYAEAQAGGPVWNYGVTPVSTSAPSPVEPSWGQRMNAEAAGWTQTVMDNLDSAAVSDGGGFITMAAAAVGTPARSFMGFVQGAVGTASLLDSNVRQDLSAALGNVMDDPSSVKRAMVGYYNNHSWDQILADGYVAGSNFLMGGAASNRAVGYLNKVPILGADVGAALRLSSVASDFSLEAQTIDRIRSLPQGERPDPYTYIPSTVIEAQLGEFDNGASRIMTQTNFEKYGPAQRDGTSFVMTRAQTDQLLASVGGNPRALEDALGLPTKFLDSNKLVRVDISVPRELNLRIPSGNESGANSQWIPGGKLPNGNLEAIIDLGNVPPTRYSWKPLTF